MVYKVTARRGKKGRILDEASGLTESESKKIARVFKNTYEGKNVTVRRKKMYRDQTRGVY